MAEDAGVSVRVQRGVGHWILCCVIPGDGTQGAAIAFPTIDELDRHAELLCAWLSGVSGPPETGETLL
jgi:hypothetical protein